LFGKALSFVIVIIFLAVPGGCKGNSQPVPAQPPKEVGEITDPAELEMLWQEYLYDSIATVGNTREFKSAQEIDPLYIAEFAYVKYVTEHGEESLELEGGGSTQRLFPLAMVMNYAQRYFNLTNLDLVKIEHSYDPERKAFTFGFKPNRPRPAYNSGRDWGEQLAKATRNSDGTITAVIVRNGQPKTGRIELTKTYTLKEREDGTLYFVSGRWEYINNKLVSLAGAYQRFDKIANFTGNMEELVMVGEIEGRLILANTPYASEAKASLLLVNPETMQVETQLGLDEHLEAGNIHVQEAQILVCLKDKFMVIDKKLHQIKKIPLPQSIQAKIKREAHYDQAGEPDVVFGGYDVSGDLQRLVYADEEGVKLFNTTAGTEKLLSRTVPVNGKLLKNSYHWNPRFVAQEQKVITIMTGYESTRGYTLCNLADDTVKTIENLTDSHAGTIWYDTGMLMVHSYVYDPKTQEADTVTKYLDFASGEVSEFKLQDPGETGDIRLPEYCYVGENKAAFVTYTRDNADNANNMYYVNGLDLQTLQVEPQLVAVKAADTRLLGVLADGRILFWYHLNPSENGVCITKEKK